VGPSVSSRSLLVFCSVLSLIVGALIGYFTPHPRGRPITVTTPEPTPTPTPTPTPAPLRVYVSGAVQAPDVYLLPPGSLVRDAIRAAGGPAPEADLDRINLARELSDQQQVYVPRKGEENPVPPSPKASPPARSPPPRASTSIQPRWRNSSNSRAWGRHWPSASSPTGRCTGPSRPRRT
jgi:hypothetical protein